MFEQSSESAPEQLPACLQVRASCDHSSHLQVFQGDVCARIQRIPALSTPAKSCQHLLQNRQASHFELETLALTLVVLVSFRATSPPNTFRASRSSAEHSPAYAFRDCRACPGMSASPSGLGLLLFWCVHPSRHTSACAYIQMHAHTPETAPMLPSH